MVMTCAAGLLAATRAADRARLLRFVAFADPTYRWWLAGERVTADAMPTHSLRDGAFCIAERYRAHRKSARFWRAFYAQPGNAHRGAPAGCTTVPALRSAALDAWLAEDRADPPVFAIAAE